MRIYGRKLMLSC